MIDVDQIRRLIASRGHNTVEASGDLLAIFDPVLGNPDIAEYLQHCTPDNLVQFGEMRLHPIERIEGEIEVGARPGPTIFRLGHLPIASTIGGQLICVSCQDGRVRWADGSYICDEYLCFFDGTRLRELAVNSENLVKIMPDVAEDLLELFKLVESDEISARIVKLDLGE
jgi:hypothetical protein